MLEILSPAGDLECLRAALLYGADAVYLSGQQYGMRTASANFDGDGLRTAVNLAHAAGKQVYVTCNILPRNAELETLPAYLEQLQDIGVDALIVADLGVMALMKQYAPRCALHVSTQLGVVNHQTARVLYEMGAKRVVLARELSLAEMAEIRAYTPADLELEAFVHGAMCMSYSGRCLLSSYLNGRDANHGDCSQPCRWEFQITEKSHAGQPITAVQDDEGTYLFNANDLCMIEHIAALAKAGITSFKIEGRAKAAYYVAVVTHAYRMVVDDYIASGGSPDYRVPQWLIDEVHKVSHRPYGTGFFYGSPSQNTLFGGYVRDYEVVAVVEGYRDGWVCLSQRNRFFDGDTLDVLEPGCVPFRLQVTGMRDENQHAITCAPHAKMSLEIPFMRALAPGSLLRKKRIS